MSDECYTPKWFIESARAVLGRIDLDPCSCEAANTVVQATVYLDKDDDALDPRSWKQRYRAAYVDEGTEGLLAGGVPPLKVFMNPPYGRPAGGAGPYCDRLIAEWETGNVSEAIILLNVATATKWMQPLFRFPMCFITPRMRFSTVGDDGELVSVGNSPRYDNVAVYLPRFDDPDVRRFYQEFSQHGNVQLPFGWPEAVWPRQ